MTTSASTRPLDVVPMPVLRGRLELIDAELHRERTRQAHLATLERYRAQLSEAIAELVDQHPELEAAA